MKNVRKTVLHVLSAVQGTLTAHEISALSRLPYKSTVDALCHLYNTGAVSRYGCKRLSRWAKTRPQMLPLDIFLRGEKIATKISMAKLRRQEAVELCNDYLHGRMRTGCCLNEKDLLIINSILRGRI
ncbi:MAG: hypothetical protein IJS87_06530 [Rhodocyclaceae bacterium]|nr:hypothetical protein [Rhodocyclaceae bacterium]